MLRSTYENLIAMSIKQFQREFNEVQRLQRPKRNFTKGQKSGKVKQSENIAYRFYAKKRMKKNPNETRKSSLKENRQSSMKENNKSLVKKNSESSVKASSNLKMYSFCRYPHRLKGKSSKQEKAELLLYTSDEF